jgi:hypothetical protein
MRNATCASANFSTLSGRRLPGVGSQSGAPSRLPDGPAHPLVARHLVDHTGNLESRQAFAHKPGNGRAIRNDTATRPTRSRVMKHQCQRE